MENNTPKNSFVLPAVIAAVIIIVVVVVASVRSKDLGAPVITNSPEAVATSTNTTKPKPVATTSPKPSVTKPKPSTSTVAKPATTTAPISVVSPNGGEVIKKGSHFMITWNATPAFKADYAQVAISLVASSENQAVTPPIMIITANTGSYDWFVPTGSLSANIKDNVGAYRMTTLEGKPLMKVLIQGYPLRTGESVVPFDFSTNFFTITN